MARQLGNDPQVTSSTYAHIMDELEGRSMSLAVSGSIPLVGFLGRVPLPFDEPE